MSVGEFVGESVDHVGLLDGLFVGKFVPPSFGLFVSEFGEFVVS